MLRSPIPINRLTLALALAGAALAPPAFAQSTTTPVPAAPHSEAAPPTPPLPEFPTDTLDLGADRADHMTLPVEIAGEGPWHFIIDTGSQRSIVASELAKRLGLQDLPPVNIVSIAGRETVNAVHLDHLKFGNQVVKDMPVLSIAHSNLGGAGLIGLDGLQHKRVLLDFKARKLEVSKSQRISSARSTPGTIIVEARSRLGQLILVGSRIDGHKVNVILDTGAEVSIGNMALYERLKQKRLVIPPTETTLTSVTGETVPALFTVVRRITIESVQLNNVPMVFLDAAPFAQLKLLDKPAMLLGMQMLRMFDRVAIDFGNRHVDFRLPRDAGGPGSAPDALASLW